MSGIIEGYTYDIFISYRHKDNKYDGWVTEFVANLKKELEATFKEEINIYFDVNPHDGLLETHDVDATLREKIRCLIFIPIISRTYCDPKSFAWEHEFKAFVAWMSSDRFGLKIKLPNGNITSRILPVRIHDINPADINLYESVLGGALRGIEFIYKSQGVNRPLRANEDHPQDNLNRIYYRDQINKVANAIEEIMEGLLRIDQGHIPGNKNDQEINPEGIDTLRNHEQVFIPDIHIPWNMLERIKAGKMREFRNSALNWVLIRKRKFAASLLIILSIAIVFGWKDLSRIILGNNTQREMAKTYNENAVSHFNNGDYESAMTEAERSLAADPEYSYAWSTLAAINVKLGDLDKAVRHTLEALSCDPSNKYAAYNLAYAFEEKKLNERALEWYSAAIKADSAFVEAYSALGRLNNILNRSDQAFLILKLAKDKYPESEYMYLINKNLGYALLLMDQPDEAINMLELSLQIRPDEPETNMFLAKAYEAEGEIARSLEQWQKYIDSETDSTKVRVAKQHRKELAIRQLKEIIK